MRVFSSRLWRDRRRAQWAALLAALAALLLAPTAATAGFQPEDFDVQIEMGPDDPSQEQPTCTPQPDGSQLCSADFAMTASAKEAVGTVTHRSSGLSGSISTVCDFDMRQHMVMRIPAGFSGAPQFVELSGSGRQSCSWHMSFDDGSSLTGRINGQMSMSLSGAATNTMHMSARFDVDVVAGTGQFDQMVGSGSFGHEEDFQMPTGPPPGASAAGLRSAAVHGSAGSGMNLKLRRGKQGVRVVSPGKTLKRSDATRLHAVTVPKASCKGAATKGGKKVKLGGARADADGSVLFSGALGKKLGAGRWNVSVACAFKGKNGRGKAVGKSAVNIS